VRPSDEVVLVVPVDGGYVRRWWRIRQPAPSVALSLRTQISAALGPAAEFAARMILSLDVESEETLRATQDADEALALRAWRRARSGRALVRDPDPTSDDPEERLPEKIQDATNRLWSVLRIVSRKTGVQLDGPALLGLPENAQGGQHTWRRIGLGHLLLLGSDLQFGGGEEEACFPVEEDAAAMALARAVNEGHAGKFVAALDDVLASADELALLITWATLHMFRPF
jgi:hypothetical protein